MDISRRARPPRDAQRHRGIVNCIKERRAVKRILIEETRECCCLLSSYQHRDLNGRDPVDLPTSIPRQEGLALKE